MVAKKKRRVVRKQSKSIISDEIFIPNHSGMLDAGKIHRTPTDDLDPVNKKYVDDADALKLNLNTSNDPLTGNLEISKATPEQKLTDTGDSNSTRVTRTDTDAVAQRFNVVKTPGNTGNALDYDGSNDELSAGDNTDILGAITLVAWIKPAALVSGKLYPIISKGHFANAGNNDGFEFAIANLGAGRVNEFELAMGNNDWDFSVSPDNAITVGVWQHIAATWSGVTGEAFKLYKNGSEVTPDLTETGISAIKTSPRNLLLGDNLIGGVRTNYSGLMDEVAVWDAEKSANDISDMYNGGSGLKLNAADNFPTDGGSMGTNLELLYHFDESAMGTAPGGTDVEDFSGNGYNGTTAGAMTDSDFVLGIVGNPAADNETSVWKSKDGIAGAEKGIQTFGDSDGRTVIDGKTIRFNINDSEVAQIDATGTLFWTGDNTGLAYGSCYGNEIAWQQAAAVQNTWYDVSDADMVDGELNGVTHDGSGKLTVLKAGRYKIDVEGDFEADAQNVHIQVAVSINGTETGAFNHFNTFGTNKQQSMGLTGIYDLAANDTINVSLRTTDVGAPELDIDHLMIVVINVGGT